MVFLVSWPVYGLFELDFGNTDGLEIVYADIKGVDPFSPGVVARYQEAFDTSATKGVKVKGVLIVNPHNPLGMYTSPVAKANLTKAARSMLSKHCKWRLIKSGLRTSTTTRQAHHQRCLAKEVHCSQLQVPQPKRHADSR